MRRQLFNENGVSAYQRSGAVPGGHHAYVGLTPVAGGMPWEGEADEPLAPVGATTCGATTRAGDPCRIDPQGESFCHVHAR